MWAKEKAVGLDEITQVTSVAKKRRFPRAEPGAPNIENSERSGCSTGPIREEGGKSSDCGRKAVKEKWVTHSHRCCLGDTPTRTERCPVDVATWGPQSF